MRAQSKTWLNAKEAHGPLSLCKHGASNVQPSQPFTVHFYIGFGFFFLGGGTDTFLGGSDELASTI
jgi:hypothetical protein